MSWKDRRESYELESYERALNSLQYPSVFQCLPEDRGIGSIYYKLPDNALALWDVTLLLAASFLAPPHGLDMLVPRPLPDLPKVTWNTSGAKAQTLAQRARELKQRFQDQYHADAESLDALREGCLANDPAAIQAMISLTHVRHRLPKPLFLPFNVNIDFPSRIALCTIDIPDFAHLPIAKRRAKSWPVNWVSVSAAEKKRCSETILHSLCLRAVYLVAYSDAGDWFDTVALNANQHWFDSATGAPCEGIIASLQAPKEEIRQLRLDQVDPKACFRHLKGIADFIHHFNQSPQFAQFLFLTGPDRRIIKQAEISPTIWKKKLTSQQCRRMILNI